MPNKKSAIILILALVLILGGIFVYNKYYYQAKVINLPGVSSPTEDSIGTSTARDYDSLFAKGLEYKIKGDAGDQASYDKAIEAFSAAIEISEGKYWLPYLNLANTYRAAGVFSKADIAYDKALEISGGSEIAVYQAKIESWLFDPARTPSEIKKLFEEAIGNVMDNVNLIKSYAGYLRDRGDKTEAIEQFEVLSKKFPDNKAYLEEIKILKN